MLLIYLGAVAASVFGARPDELLDQSAAKGRRIEAVARGVADGESVATARSSRSVRDLVPGLDAEEVGNVIMFVPFGLLFPVAMPRMRRWTVPLGVTLSAGIELTQGLFLPWRSPSLNDVRWNSAGAVIGFSAWFVLRSAYRLLAVPSRRPVTPR